MKRGGPLPRYKPLKAKTRIRVAGHSETADLKKEIQRLLRQIVIIRDGLCQRCGVTYGTPGVVFQCDHLLSRAHSATFAESRLCVLVCQPCHAWKSLGSNLRKGEYDAHMRTVLPAERVALWDACERDSWRPVRKGAYDWRIHIAALEQELRALQ